MEALASLFFVKNVFFSPLMRAGAAGSVENDAETDSLWKTSRQARCGMYVRHSSRLLQMK